MTLQCPCCRTEAAALNLFEVTSDIDRREVRILICRRCTTLITQEELEAPEAEILTGNEEGSSNFYRGFAERYRVEIENSSGLVDFVMSEFGGDGPQSLLEFGFGSGCFLLAAAGRIPEVIGVDINHSTIRGILADSALAVPNLTLHRQLSELSKKVDAIFCWHVLEHLKDAHSLVEAFARLLRPGGRLFFQVPLYRPAHICRTHIAFFNAASVPALFEEADWDPPKLMFDLTNSFLTGVVRRREGAVAPVSA